ncbi:hypothetical protein SAMN06265348_1248 [Pedobacter westerhofensis]|uniref:Uncharacterized protein n=1 Tax=Pedobacter westerhofensis TaxID=425512 RepID=A0A521FTX3_9SPHI|nr:hypothetical protein SAMN06265348_1248 [Pedobacter westerhofensis]
MVNSTVIEDQIIQTLEEKLSDVGVTLDLFYTELIKLNMRCQTQGNKEMYSIIIKFLRAIRLYQKNQTFLTQKSSLIIQDNYHIYVHEQI